MAFLEENLVLEIGLGTRLLSPSGLKGSWKAFSGFRHEELWEEELDEANCNISVEHCICWVTCVAIPQTSQTRDCELRNTKPRNRERWVCYSLSSRFLLTLFPCKQSRNEAWNLQTECKASNFHQLLALLRLCNNTEISVHCFPLIPFRFCAVPYPAKTTNERGPESPQASRWATILTAG
jgi:hypothetical protein